MSPPEPCRNLPEPIENVCLLLRENLVRLVFLDLSTLKQLMKLFWFILWVSVGLGTVFGSPVLECGEGGVRNLADYTSMLRDPSGTMTPEGAVLAYDRGEFVALDGATPGLGFTKDAVWFVFNARSSEPMTRELVAELETSRLRDVDWYVMERDGRVRHTSSSMPAQGDVMRQYTRYPLFAFTVWSDRDTRVFFRVQTDTALLIPMRAGSIIGYSQSVEFRALKEYGHLGVILMVMLISLMGALLMRQWLYWLLLCMMGFFAGYDLIYTGIYAWWNGPWIGFVSRQFMLFLANMWVFSMVLFT
ncbi:MAG: hypothetical protein EOL87_10275, partial [Spartobacteria bacterium]|nr:hypothetical protein [Spartobacteria bacterium]